MSDQQDASSFEESLVRLEQIVRQLEEGRLSLSDAVARYEEGVKCLRGCYSALKIAERKIEVLTGMDSNGNPITERFDEPEETLGEKQQNRAQKRSASPPERADGVERPRSSRGMDTSKGLF